MRPKDIFVREKAGRIVTVDHPMEVDIAISGGTPLTGGRGGAGISHPRGP
ncbi:MAG: hypothetical protein WBF43_11945 [Methylocella sp.]